MKNILLSGASRGLGLEIARQLLNEEGYQVYGFSRQTSKGIEELQATYPARFHWQAIDLEDLNTLREKVFSQFLPAGLPLYALINNAAIAYDDLASNAKLPHLQKMFNINTLAPILLSKYSLRNMLLHRTAGCLIHVSSISTQTGYKGLSMYAASKGALEAFSKNIAREWGPKGIRSNCIIPGFMDTEMSASLSEEQKQKIYRRNALKTATTLSSVAGTILFLLSKTSSSITAQKLIIDSGSQ